MHLLLYNSCVEHGCNLLYFTGLLNYPRYLFMKLEYVTKNSEERKFVIFLVKAAQYAASIGPCDDTTLAT